MNRVSTGLPELDEHLGGGLLPGTLTAVVGATGVGKTQLGIHFANAGQQQEGFRGLLVDVSSRGDSQSHASYAQRLCNWTLTKTALSELESAAMWAPGEGEVGGLLDCGIVPTECTADPSADWQSRDAWTREFNRQISSAVAFLYHHFVRGTRRVVIDGLPPTPSRRDSLSYDIVELIQARVLKQPAEWVAREVYRQHFRQRESQVESKSYPFRQLSGIVLCTSQHSLLEPLIAEPIQADDFVAEANTLIYMGRVREGDRLGRRLYIAKHRGSKCSDHLISFNIDEQGLHLD